MSISGLFIPLHLLPVSLVRCRRCGGILRSSPRSSASIYYSCDDQSEMRAKRTNVSEAAASGAPVMLCCSPITVLEQGTVA